jgi:Cu/Ag efflux protein CusF
MKTRSALNCEKMQSNRPCVKEQQQQTIQRKRSTSMKKLLTSALAIVFLAAFFSISVAAQKGEKSPMIKQQAEIQEITSEVTKVDSKANTFTVKGKDFELTLPKQRGGELPEMGQKLVVKLECTNVKPFTCSISITWEPKSPKSTE